MNMKFPSPSVICTILLGGAIAIGSSASLVIDVTTTLNPVAIGLDLLVMLISYLTIWNGISSYLINMVAKKQMEQEWEYRVQPMMQMFADTAGRIDKIEQDVLSTNLKVNSTLDYIVKSQDMDASKTMILPGVSFKFITKILVLIVFTFSSLVYATEFPMGFVHYFILGMYLIWWIVLTAEYKLFEKTEAWVFAVAPVMIIPTLGIIMTDTIGINNMIGILFFGMFVYAYSYFTWASYTTTGYKLIDPKPIIYILKNKFKKNKTMR